MSILIPSFYPPIFLLLSNHDICTYFELPQCASSTCSILPVVMTEHKGVFLLTSLPNAQGPLLALVAGREHTRAQKVYFQKHLLNALIRLLICLKQSPSVCMRYLLTFNMEETSHAIREVKILLLD